ncbi:MAG: xylulokinase [Clostridiales bacterium]|nr:xylulokinase [Clostridiales bacterium]
MKQYLIAHDLGTSGDKATLFHLDGRLLHSVTHSYPTHFFNGNWAEQNPLDWWESFCATNRQLLAGRDAGQVAAVAFSGQMMGCVLVDAQGLPVRHALIWADLRATEQARRFEEAVGADDFYRITGHRASASYSLAKLLWVRDHEPEAFRRAHRMLNAKDYLVYRLTGRFVTDYSDASGTNLFDLNRMDWSDAILGATGVDRALLPELHPSTDVIGEVTAGIAAETGLAPGTAIVLGAGDGVCASTGAASVSPGVTYNYLGSSSWIAYTAPAPVFDPQMRTFTWAHMVPGAYCPTGTMQAAGNSFTFVKQMLCDGLEQRAQACGGSVYAEINELLKDSPVGSRGLLFLPYLLGERSPRWNPLARGAYLGLTMEHTRADLLHAAVEGIALNLCVILDIFRREQSVGPLHLIGGLAQSDSICRVLADVFGIDVVRMNHLEEATSMGAAVCGGVGVGALSDFSCVHRFIQPEQTLPFDPETHGRYAPVKALFEQAYEAMLPLYPKLAAL